MPPKRRLPDTRASGQGDHNHQTDIDLIFRRQCIQELHNAVSMDPTLMSREVWRRVSCNRQNFPPFHEVRPAIERFWASLLPAIPHNVADVDICNVWAAINAKVIIWQIKPKNLKLWTLEVTKLEKLPKIYDKNNKPNNKCNIEPQGCQDCIYAINRMKKTSLSWDSPFFNFNSSFYS